MRQLQRSPITCLIATCAQCSLFNQRGFTFLFYFDCSPSRTAIVASLPLALEHPHQISYHSKDVSKLRTATTSIYPSHTAVRLPSKSSHIATTQGCPHTSFAYMTELFSHCQVSFGPACSRLATMLRNFVFLLPTVMLDPCHGVRNVGPYYCLFKSASSAAGLR